MGFYLQKAKAVFKGFDSKPKGKGDVHELESTLRLSMRLDDQGTHDAADFFFPGYSIVEDRIAELDGMHPGLSTTVRLSPPAMTFVIYDGAGLNKVFQLKGANIKGTVSFKIDGKGEGAMDLTVAAPSFTDEEWAALKAYIGADVRVSALDMQADMFGGTGIHDEQSDLEEAAHGMTGGELKAEREARGWTREVMAQMSGMSPKSIGRYERGQRIMATDIAEKMRIVFANNPADEVLDVDHGNYQLGDDDVDDHQIVYDDEEADGAGAAA